MKIKKILSCAATLPILLTAAPIVLTSCNNSLCPTVNSAETKVVPYYQIVSDPLSGGAYYSKSSVTQKVTHFNGSPIPYIDLDETFNSYAITARTMHGKTVITNIYNYEWIIIDYATQTIQFSDWDKNMDMNPSSYGALTQGCGGGNNYYNSVKQTKYFAGKTQSLSLRDYGLQAFLYAEPYVGMEAHGYVPYHIIRNIFDLSLVNVPCDYNGYGFFQIPGGKSTGAIACQKTVKEYATIYNKEYMEYYYNILALTLDCRYGLLERESRANPGTKIEYMPDGAYKMLAPYHDRLVSTDDNVSAEALREIFTTKLDDGGHARYVNLNAFSTEAYPEAGEQGAETKHTFAVFDTMGKARDASGLSKSGQIIDGYAEYENEEKTKKIAYITFDGFTAPSSTSDWSDLEKEKGRELPSNTSASNYMNDTLRLTMYANEKIKADRKGENKIKDVVVDISNNGGGTVYTEHFIASWLCGGVTEKIYNPTTGAYCEYQVKADIDGDGDFDAEDTIADLNLYVITSSASFSCGNMLPCNVADSAAQRTGKKTILMGTKSGGGACFVDDQIFIGPSSYVRSSSTFHMLRNSSLYQNYVTVDTGAEITDGWAIDDMNNAADFYKRDEINKKIWA